MPNRLLLFFIATVFLAALLQAPVWAGEVDILVQKLVEKGILSPQDAKEILKEVKEEAKKERAAVVKETAEAIKKDGDVGLAEVPKWVRKTKLKGDLRLRYQLTDRSRKPDRQRGRYRLRVGFLTEITDKLDVGFGLATGGNDPRSTNQTLTNSFESPDIRLNYAYARYKPFSWLTLIGGKFKNPLWRPSDLLWDTDINPEGISAMMDYPVGSSVSLFLNTGLWLIDERKCDENDPVMFVAQPGYKLKLGNNAYLKNAVAFYQFDNVKGTTLDHSSETNTLRKWKDVLRHDFDAYSISAELGIKMPLDLVPFFAVLGSYVNNRTISSEDEGHLIGFKMGDKKVKKKYQWQIKAMYRRLERDAWLDIFPDSDAYSGETNVKGYEVVLQYGLLDNVSLALDYYFMKRIRGKSLSESLLQADLNVKF